MEKILKHILYLASSILFLGCQGFLDEKPSVSLVVPSTLDDLQALLDNTDQAMNNDASFTLLRTDEFIAEDALLASTFVTNRDIYLWEHEPFPQDEISLEWSRPYLQILNSNIVLEEAENFIPSNQRETDRLQQLIGAAHFFRGLAYFNLAQVFAQPYNPIGGNNALSFPLRDRADPNIRFELSTVEEVYAFILSDMEVALETVPITSEIPTRPNRTSVQAMLARIYLSMELYEKAGEYAELVLSTKSDLIDYNDLVSTGVNPFDRFNTETVFYSEFSFNSFFLSPLLKVSLDFLSLYREGDLRQTTFFAGNVGGWKNQIGHYSGSIEFFSGITTGEIMLIAAEVAARNENHNRAKEVLLLLSENRYIEGFIPELSEVTNEDLLTEILDERKRELIGRGVRWSDLRRLNRDERFAITIIRTTTDKNVTIPPNDPRYTSPIPPRERNLEGF